MRCNADFSGRESVVGQGRPATAAQLAGNPATLRSLYPTRRAGTRYRVLLSVKRGALDVPGRLSGVSTVKPVEADGAMPRFTRATAAFFGFGGFAGCACAALGPCLCLCSALGRSGPYISAVSLTPP